MIHHPSRLDEATIANLRRSAGISHETNGKSPRVSSCSAGRALSANDLLRGWGNFETTLFQFDFRRAA
jgi:hypothetical protein